jgi:hypothetical protein
MATTRCAGACRRATEHARERNVIPRARFCRAWRTGRGPGAQHLMLCSVIGRARVPSRRLRSDAVGMEAADAAWVRGMSSERRRSTSTYSGSRRNDQQSGRQHGHEQQDGPDGSRPPPASTRCLIGCSYQYRGAQPCWSAAPPVSARRRTTHGQPFLDPMLHLQDRHQLWYDSRGRFHHLLPAA